MPIWRKTMNLPVAFVEKMKVLLGEEFDQYIKCYEENRLYGLRVNTKKISVEEFQEICPFDITPIPWIENGFYYDGETVQASKHPYYFAGLYYLQEPSAMTPANRLPIEPGDKVLDVCAAPGGKSTHLAELMNNNGCIYAFDKHEHKIEIIDKNAERMGINIIKAMVWDSTCVKEELVGCADKVLADVPCSGLGIIIQYKILEASAKYLKVGGSLVYSTCTVNRRENEDVITKFVENNPEFEFEKIVLPSSLNRENKGYITLYPNIDNTDGFFISRIKRCK